MLILAQILKHEEVKVAYLDKAYYHYIKNEDSITHYVSQKTYNGLKMYLQKSRRYCLPITEGLMHSKGHCLLRFFKWDS